MTKTFRTLKSTPIDLDKCSFYSRWFCTPPSLLRLCIALFTVAEGMLLLDIGWFVLPFEYSRTGTLGTLKIVIWEVLWSIRGSYSAIWSLPLANVEWHSDPWPTVTSQPIRLSTNLMTFIPSLTFIELWVVSMEHLQRVWYASRERIPFRTPGSVTFFGFACAPIVETRFLELAKSLLDFSPWIPLGTFLILLCVSLASSNILLQRMKYLRRRDANMFL